jgi:hypothetical protein
LHKWQSPHTYMCVRDPTPVLQPLTRVKTFIFFSTPLLVNTCYELITYIHWRFPTFICAYKHRIWYLSIIHNHNTSKQFTVHTQQITWNTRHIQINTIQIKYTPSIFCTGRWHDEGRKVSILEMVRMTDYSRCNESVGCAPLLVRKMPVGSRKNKNYWLSAYCRTFLTNMKVNVVFDYIRM